MGKTNSAERLRAADGQGAADDHGAMDADSPLAIDYVSPLPPVRSGIADYSFDLLEFLDAKCDLRLIHLPGQPVDEAIRQRYTVVGAERLGEDGRLPLYQMGNNHYHGDVWRLAMAQPGVLTLHDLVLHHFLIERTVKNGDFDGYRRQLLADHGWIGEAAAMPMRWPGGSGSAAQFALPAHRTLLRAQRGVLTHSRWAAEMLREEMPDLRLRSLAMGIPLPAPPADGLAADFRRRHGLPADQPVLGSLGFQTPIKRTDVVIRALASAPLSNVHLMVAGEAAATLNLDDIAAEAGVSERVHLLGFLPFEDFEAAIAACDLCLNLRYPTAGETSASLLRILAVGRPAVVSDYAQSADLPDAGVVRIPVGDGEQEALIERLADLLANPEALTAMGRAARRHIAEFHSPEAAADAVLTACETWNDATPPGSGDVSACEPPPLSSLISRRLEGAIEVQGAGLHDDEVPWPAGERRRLDILLHNTGEARWLAAERLDGGVAVEVRMEPEGDGEPQAHWLPLPTDLAPGASHTFRLRLRRPLGAASLRILPHVLGRAGFNALGGPTWQQDL